MKFLAIVLLLVAPSMTVAQHSHPDNETPAELMAGLGSVNHPVSTNNAEAQKFFNQGLACLYGFNHEEAVRSFKRAAVLDPKLAMANWGIALALGSNYNLQAEGPALLEAFSNLQKAQRLSTTASASDRAYIDALAKRYSADLTVDTQKLAVDYKNAMSALVKTYPDDLDAATLYAESLMNLRPWKLWNAHGQPAEDTLEIVSVLESVLRRNPNHPGANHYYIHAVEGSNDPARALPSADRLGKLAPLAGHLVHMPSHIYIRTGDYSQAAQSNTAAITADREFIAKTKAQGVYTLMYYNHNIHFLASADAMRGRFVEAIKTARELEAGVKPHLSTMPMLEMFVLYPTVTEIRFAMWDEVLKNPAPQPQWKISTAFWHFSRGLAYAAMYEPAKAETELSAFEEVAKGIPANAPVGNNVASRFLEVARRMLQGKIALARHDKPSAYQLLQKAVTSDDAIVYNEPPDWDLPTREIYGGALLMNGDNAKAEGVFRAELKKHPRNGRALFGLWESLKRQGKRTEAKKVQREFQQAWSAADTKLTVKNLAGFSR